MCAVTGNNIEGSFTYCITCPLATVINYHKPGDKGERFSHRALPLEDLSSWWLFLLCSCPFAFSAFIFIFLSPSCVCSLSAWGHFWWHLECAYIIPLVCSSWFNYTIDSALKEPLIILEIRTLDFYGGTIQTLYRSCPFSTG